jgi:hypothetical protein
MSETAQEYLVLFAVLAAIAIFAVVRLLTRTSALNQDPVQRELAALIVEYANSGLDESAATLFAVSSQRVFMTNFITEERDQRNRFAHALSMARFQLSPAQYEFVRQVLR